MKRVIIIMLAYLPIWAYTSVAQELNWGSQISAMPNDPFSTARGWSSTTDSDGNLYTTGEFFGKMDFDPGTDSFYLEAVNHTDVFICKLNANGELVWAKQFAGTSLGIGRAIVADGDNDIYISGVFRGMVDFNPGPDTFLINGPGIGNGFICKLNREGHFLWAQKYGAEFNSIRLDLQGNIHAIGSFSGPQDIDPGPGTFTLTSNGLLDIVLAKLNPEGNLIWAKNIGGSNDEFGRDCDIDFNGNVYSTGSYKGTVDFDPGPGTYELTSVGPFTGDDIFICKFDSSGTFLWASGFGSVNSGESGRFIRIDHQQNLVITGRFLGEVDFDPGPGNTLLTSAGVANGFINKYDGNGQLIWARLLGSTQNIFGTSLCIDPSNHIYTTGTFSGIAVFNSGIESIELTAPPPSNHTFVCRLDQDGTCQWAEQFGGTGEAIGNTIASDLSHRVFVMGEFNGTGDFDPGMDSLIFTTPGTYYNTFLASLQGCSSSYFFIQEVACSSFTSPSGNYTWTTDGIYMDTIYNQDGCDSILTIQLDIIQTDTSVSYNPPTLMANTFGGVSYQWLDCNNNYAIIPGETGQTFTPVSSGSYAVAFYPNNTCDDTSACYDVTLVSVDGPISNDLISIHPNPTSGTVIIQSACQMTFSCVAIRNMMGQVIEQTIMPEGTSVSYTLDGPPGLYIIDILTSGDVRYCKKIMKE